MHRNKEIGCRSSNVYTRYPETKIKNKNVNWTKIIQKLQFLIIVLSWNGKKKTTFFFTNPLSTTDFIFLFRVEFTNCDLVLDLKYLDSFF